MAGVLPWAPSAATRAFAMLSTLIVLAALAAPAAPDDGAAPLDLAEFFGDHMVVQRDLPIPIWGVAEPGQAVTVAMGAATATAVADTEGAWTAELPALAAGGPHRITVRAGAASIELEDVLVGEVWLCSGQSNMRWRLWESADAEVEIAAADLPAVRLFDMVAVTEPVGGRWGPELLAACNERDYFPDGRWTRCTPDAARGFSAVGYHFGRELSARLGVPVGLVCNAIGGTPVESYISRAGLESHPLLAPFAVERAAFVDSGRLSPWPRGRLRTNLGAWFDEPVGAMPGHPFLPSFLYDSGVAPLARLPLGGVIWYQGESNATSTDSQTPSDEAYCRAGIETLVADWRRTFEREDLPFLWVQLAAHSRRWMEFREVQRQCLDIPGTGMVVTIDIGDAADVHPRDKREVGRRLALLALADVYGADDFGARSPSPVGLSIEGGDVRVDFVDTAGGLQVRGAGELRGFELVGADGAWAAARARVAGDRAIVWSADVPEPVAVRYAWAPVPDGNLVGGTGLPATPFVEGAVPAVAAAGAVGGWTSFEAAPDGEFTRVETAVGVWIAEEGHARIDPEHAKSGRRCLHLLGGDDREVELALAATDAVELSFWAERWTRTDPFEFRVSALVDGDWREVYVGDEEVVIGTFRTRVRAVVPTGSERLRFRCTSPSGVLIDDLRLEAAAPQRVVRAWTGSVDVPALGGGADNPFARLVLEARGSAAPLRVREVAVEVATAFEGVGRVVLTTPDGARTEPVEVARGSARFSVDVPLLSGDNGFDFSVAAGTPPAGFVGACTEVVLADGRRLVPKVDGSLARLRSGVALRDGGDDGVAVHRIPGLVTTPAGTLIAVYDLRWGGWGDLPGDIDVGMSRSTDGGVTWEPMRTVMDMGDDPTFEYDGVGDPSILVDEVTGTVWIAATWSHGDRSWHGSGPGLAPEETGQLMLVRSDDDGRSWSEPINITAQVKRPEWCFLLPGPGRGITTDDGTLVFPAQFQDTPENGRLPRSTILYSRDRGATWELGTGMRDDTTEAQVVELEPGVLMLNARNNRGEGRAIYTTTDLGRTWSEHPTSRHALPEPVCNAGLIRGPGDLLIFCNPAVSTGPRRHMTLKASPNLGATWPAANRLLLDAGESAGYSALTMVDDETVGVLFESSRAQLVFLAVPLVELID